MRPDFFRAAATALAALTMCSVMAQIAIPNLRMVLEPATPPLALLCAIAGALHLASSRPNR